MAARKSDFIGVPIDPKTKRRLRQVAERKQRRHTEVARIYIVEGIERDERELGIERPQLATSDK